MRKHVIQIGMIFMLFICICRTTVHAESNTNRNHVDSDEYCMQTTNVEIGTAAIKQCTSEQEIEEKIIDAADITILIRPTWEFVSIDKLSIDFSKFKPEVNQTGYTVTVTAPVIDTTKNVVSKISFNVYVIDDYVPDYVTVHFANTNLSDLKIDINSQSVLKYIDIQSTTKQGYTFDGWYTDEACTRPYLLADSSAYSQQTLTTDITLYPKWTLIPTVEPTPSTSPLPESTPEPTPAEDAEEPIASATPEASIEAVIEETDADADPVQTETAETPSEVISTPEPSSAPEQVIQTQQPTTQEGTGGVEETNGEPAKPYEICMAGALGAAALGLGGSIISDLGVLRWYRRKKRERH